MLTRYYNANENNYLTEITKSNSYTLLHSVVHVHVFQTVGTASLSVHVSPSLMSPNPFMSVLDSTLCCTWGLEGAVLLWTLEKVKRGRQSICTIPKILCVASFPGFPGRWICIHGVSLVSFLMWPWCNQNRTRAFKTERQRFACSTNYSFKVRYVPYSPTDS